jgi:hypothetical protein
VPTSDSLPSRRRIAVAVTVSGLGLIGLAVLLVWASIAASAQRERLATSPSPTPYSVPVAPETTKAAPSDVLAKLPAGICAKLDRALVPADVRAMKSEEVTIKAGVDQTCLWNVYEPDRARYLTVAVEVIHSDDPELTLTEAAEEFADERDYAADTEGNAGYHADPRPIDQLGDEAFGDKARSVVEPMGHGVRYVIAGAQVVVRTGNVIVKVNWQGADYPEHSNVKTLRGENLPYDQSQAVAIALAKEAMARLR